MTIRDVQADLGFQPRTASTAEIAATSIVGGSGAYVAQNSYDTGPYNAHLTEFSPLDQILSVGGQNYFVESGTGQGLKVCIDWVTAVQGFGSIQSQLITSAALSLSSPVTMIDFGVQPATMFFQGYRQIQLLPRSASWLRWIGLQVITSGFFFQGSFVSWLALDLDSVEQGYASGFPIK